MTVIAPYGSWDSSITISMLTEAGTPVGGVTTDAGDLYWTKSPALEGGRVAEIVRKDAHGLIADAVPEGFNSRSRVHEYGGGSYAVKDGVLVSCDFADQRVYRIENGAATPITPEPKIPAGDRYGDFEFHCDRLISVRERHKKDREPVNTLVTFPIDGSDKPRVITKGHDFYANPRVSPDGVKSCLVVMGPPQYAVGRDRTVVRRSRRRRHDLRTRTSCRRRGRVDIPTGVEPGRSPSLRVGPDRVVESVPPDRRPRRGSALHGCRLRSSAMGPGDAPLRLPTQ